MKKLLALILLFFSSICFSQDIDEEDLLKEYGTILYSELALYNEKNDGLTKKAIQEAYLDEKIDEILKTVIFNNSSISSNSNAISFSLEDENTNISTSIVTPLGKNVFKDKDQLFMKTGVFATGKDNLFNIYSSESWQNDTGLNLGLIWKFSASTFYNKKEAINIQYRRKFYVDSLRYAKGKMSKEELRKINSKINIIHDLFKERKNNDTSSCGENKTNRQIEIDNGNESDSAYPIYEKIRPEASLTCKQIKEIKEELIAVINKKGMLNVYDSLLKVKSKYKYYLESKNLKKLVQNELTKFDKGNDVTFGYSLHWVDINFSGSNATYNIPNDSILTKDLLQSNNLNKFDRNFKFSSSVNYNYTCNTHVLIYVQGGAKYINGNLLDNNLIEGSPTIKEENNSLLLFDEKENQLGNYASLNRVLEYGAFNLYGSLFFNKNKTIGVDAQFEHNYLIGKRKDSGFRNNFSTFFGLLFRNREEDDTTKSTFGIEAGFENTQYSAKAKDNFVARIKVGIPFNIYSKKEE